MIARLRNLLDLLTPHPPQRPSRPRAWPPVVSAATSPITPARNYFEALNTVDHRTPIPYMGMQANGLLSRYSRGQLAGIARYLWDNVGLVFYATDLVANYSTPMVPRAATLDRKWNEAANGLFDDWAERADFSGRVDFLDRHSLVW